MATKKQDMLSKESQDQEKVLQTESSELEEMTQQLPEAKNLDMEVPQTDLETSLEMLSSEEEQNLQQEGSADCQTDIEKPKKQRRRKKTDDIPTQSDTGADQEENKPGDGVEESVKSKKRVSTRPAQTILSIDERLSVQTDDEKAQNDLLDLMESLKTRKILTGTIQGVECPEENPSRSLAVTYHGDFKVLIPAEEAVELPEDLRGHTEAEILHYNLTKRLGAEVDYIIKGIDAKAGIAVASRLEAMADKRKAYYFGTDRDGNNLLYEGICAEARVVSVIRAGIFVDLFGLEIYIPLRELSYQRLLDANTQFRTGQRILVKILGVERNNKNQVKAIASVKRAGENPYEKALRRYSVGNRYVGTVSMVDTNGVFVALDGGIDCLCSYPKRGRPPRGARVTVKILGVNQDSNRIWGAITHIAAPR